MLQKPWQIRQDVGVWFAAGSGPGDAGAVRRSVMILEARSPRCDGRPVICAGSRDLGCHGIGEQALCVGIEKGP